MGKIIVGGEHPFVLDVSTGERAAVEPAAAGPVQASAREAGVAEEVSAATEEVVEEAPAPAAAEPSAVLRKKGVPSRKAGKGRK